MKYIILDLDNVIADDGWRISHIKNKSVAVFERYHDYQLLAGFDELCNENLFRGRNCEIIISTGRSSFYKAIATYWLHHHNIKHHTLMMRDANDERTSLAVKRNHMRRIMYLANDIHTVYDDHPKVIEMYRAAGIQARQILIHSRKLYKGADA